MKTAFVFPGQGSQKVGMMQDLYENHACVRERFSAADEALGWSLSDLVFKGPADKLVQTEYTQPAILTASVAAYDVLLQAGWRPAMVAGHSLGEYSALVAAGSLRFADAVRTVQARGRFMQEAVPLGEGKMAAIIRLAREKVVAICNEVTEKLGKPVEAVNFNCPGQIVVAGTTAAVDLACERFREAGAGRVVPLAVSAPFHSVLMKPAAKRLAEVLAAIEIYDAQIPVYANVNAKPMTKASEIQETLVEQVAHPVLWEDSIRRMMADGMEQLVEVGPGNVLTGFMRKIDAALPTFSVADESGVERALAAWKGTTHD